MRTLSLLSAVALFAACDQSGDQWGVDFDDDSDDVTDTSDTGDVDTDDDTEDIDVDTDTGITGVAGDCHPADPLDKAGWSKTYRSNYEGSIGTEVQTPLGVVTAPNGESAYAIQSTFTMGNDTITQTRYANCSNEQAYWLGEEKEGTLTSPDSPFGLPTSVNSTVKATGGSAPYLPSLVTLEVGAQIEYSYSQMTTKHDTASLDFEDIFGSLLTLNCASPDAPVDDQGQTQNDSNCIDVEGVLQVYGEVTHTVNGVTYQAYEIEDTRTEMWSQAPSTGGSEMELILEIFGGMFGMGGSEDTTTITLSYYVEGIGVVEQLTYDMTNVQVGQLPTDEQLLLTRQLQTFSGL